MVMTIDDPVTRIVSLDYFVISTMKEDEEDMYGEQRRPVFEEELTYV